MGSYCPPSGYYTNKPRVHIDAMYCTSCMKCISVCPQKGAISAGKANGRPFVYVKDAARCVGCARCVNVCLTKAVRIYLT